MADPGSPDSSASENDGEKEGWLYVRGSTKNLGWATRVNGIATGGTCRNLVVRNLNTRNFLNDGFNIHGDSRELRFEAITGYDCFDEGFSAHETSECRIDGGRFSGNENGVADVNASETVYRNCEFTGNVNVEVLFAGAPRHLIDCRIVNTTAVTALSAGPRAEGRGIRPQTDPGRYRCPQPGEAGTGPGQRWNADCGGGDAGEHEFRFDGHPLAGQTRQIRLKLTGNAAA